MVDHEVIVAKTMHLHSEGVTHARDGKVVDGSPEHVGSVEILVASGIRQDFEDDGGRCVDSARSFDPFVFGSHASVLTIPRHSHVVVTDSSALGTECFLVVAIDGDASVMPAPNQHVEANESPQGGDARLWQGGPVRQSHAHRVCDDITSAWVSMFSSIVRNELDWDCQCRVAFTIRGERRHRCSKSAQVRWPKLFLAQPAKASVVSR